MALRTLTFGVVEETTIRSLKVKLPQGFISQPSCASW